MRLWRVLMSVRVTGIGHDYTRHLSVFYVHAVMGSDAALHAIRIGCAAASPADEYRSSGSVTEVDRGTLDPINLDRAYSWDDGTHATEVRS